MGGDFVSLTWEKPRSDGGGRITGYFIEKQEAGSNKWVRVNSHPTPANIFNVGSLIEDREYEFRVFAVNEAGESKPSSATRKVKVKDPKGHSSLLLLLPFLCFKKNLYFAAVSGWLSG